MIKASEENQNAQGNGFEEVRYGELAELASELPELGGPCALNTNRERAALAAQALIRFASSTGQDTGEPLTDIVTDMLANMMHLCHLFASGSDGFQRLLNSATGHFEAELHEEQE